MTGLRSIIAYVGVSSALCLCVVLSAGAVGAPQSDRKNPPVWIVAFSAKDCPACEFVKQLLSALSTSYAVRVRSFDVEQPDHYKLFKRLEGIHGEGGFSVPLVMVGDTILIGEGQIRERLEITVSKLARSGGATLPYLGPEKKGPKRPAPRSERGRASEICEDCRRGERGRPPAVEEEWRKLKALMKKAF